MLLYMYLANDSLRSASNNNVHSDTVDERVGSDSDRRQRAKQQSVMDEQLPASLTY